MEDINAFISSTNNNCKVFSMVIAMAMEEELIKSLKSDARTRIFNWTATRYAVLNIAMESPTYPGLIFIASPTATLPIMTD